MDDARSDASGDAPRYEYVRWPRRRHGWYREGRRTTSRYVSEWRRDPPPVPTYRTVYVSMLTCPS